MKIKSIFFCYIVLLVSSCALSASSKELKNEIEIRLVEALKKEPLHANEMPYGALLESEYFTNIRNNADAYYLNLKDIYESAGASSDLKVAAFLLMQCVSDINYLRLYSEFIVNTDFSQESNEYSLILSGGGPAWGARTHFFYEDELAFKKLIDRAILTKNLSASTRSIFNSMIDGTALSYLNAIGVNKCK